MSSTYPEEGRRLGAALREGSAAAIQAALPRTRSKLNRPFDVVNLY
jgi:hypothetical protein